MATKSHRVAQRDNGQPHSDDARQRITRIVEGWSLTEPLMFAAWTLHETVLTKTVATIRVGHGRVECNSDFIRSLTRAQLRDVLRFEATRILLGHPYARRQPRADVAYTASNITIQECLHTNLPMPRARDEFEDDSLDHQYYEFYYAELARRDEEPPTDEHQDPTPSPGVDETETPGAPTPTPVSGDAGDGDQDPSDEPAAGDESVESPNPQSSDESMTPSSDLDSYADGAQLGAQNAEPWESDDLFKDEIASAVTEAQQTGQWGSLPGTIQERLIANLNPPLDYRGMLRRFRQSVLSVNRCLTRMKPSRRYGLSQMGSRYDFTTRLLLAVDVSGSMSHRELQKGFSVANQFFRYGIREIDVVWFDTTVHNAPETFRRARSQISIVGRGGTDFRCLIDFIDEHRQYDGMIVFTDGEAPKPPAPNNRRTQLMWLFNTQAAYKKMHGPLSNLGRTAYIQPSRWR
ncbi:MAG: VWA-like domain-containing protein [Planctomycetota bacterium]